MVRFIFICMAFLILSFVAVPVFNGVSNEHDRLTEASIRTTEAKSTPLTFEQLYASVHETDNPTPESLNAIITAAGEKTALDRFSSGFRNLEDSALGDTHAPLTSNDLTEQTEDL